MDSIQNIEYLNMTEKTAAGADEIDLKLLRLLDALYATRSVTRAAERVGMHRQSLQQKLKDLGLTRRFVLNEDSQDEA